MKTATWKLLLLGLLLPATPACAAESDSARPNVLLIFTDDQGSIDLNCYGAKDLITPHMDSLARRGVRWTQFYAAAPVCSPSRGALLTGRYPQHNGVTGNGRALDPDEVTMAEMFKRAGYATALVGKWHLSEEPGPNSEGFDSAFGHLGGCIDNYSHFFYWSGPNRHDLFRDGQEVFHDGEYFPDLMVREVERVLEANRDRPFFLYWAINMPHYPLQGESHWRERYAHLPYPRNLYASFLSTMDEQIGQVLRKLDDLELRERTIIVLQSDHGHSTEIRTHGGGGSAGPYRGAKFSLFEGGIRVPAIISWPGRLPEGEVRDQLAMAMDWLPTLAELCRVRLPDRKLDGKSLVDVLRSPQAASPHPVVHWQTGGGSRDPQWAVRSGEWKLLGNPHDTSERAPIEKGDELFLVNLAEDISEMENLARQHPAKVEELKRLHQQWVKEFDRER